MTTHHRTVGAHLVGGLQAPSATAAMTIASQILGRHLDAITDGETGPRSQWIQWQVGRLLEIPGIEMKPNVTKVMPTQTHKAYHNVFPVLTVDPSVTSLPERHLGYADAAVESYRIYQELRSNGVIPEDVQFQVSLPTPLAVVSTFIDEADQKQFLQVYENALASEIRKIINGVSATDPTNLTNLTIQLDLAVEIGILTGAFTVTPELNSKPTVINTLNRAFSIIPSFVKRKAHLCYGDLLHQHFVVPNDLSLSVEVANAIDVDFVHMPADRDTGRQPEYYEPLRDLKTPQLALGVVDYEGDKTRTAELVNAAVSGCDRTFAVSTECGMSRLGERGDTTSLERLLALHAKIAEPLR